MPIEPPPMRPINGANVQQEKADFSRLKEMTREELIALVRLCNADMLEVALMTEEEIDKAHMLRLARDGIKNPEAVKAHSAIKERFNRTRGTPVQTTNVTMTLADLVEASYKDVTPSGKLLVSRPKDDWSPK